MYLVLFHARILMNVLGAEGMVFAKDHPYAKQQNCCPHKPYNNQYGHKSGAKILIFFYIRKPARVFPYFFFKNPLSACIYQKFVVPLPRKELLTHKTIIFMRKIFTLVALLSAFVFTAKAEVINGTCADTVNVDWSYNTDTKILSFTLKGSDSWFIPHYGSSNTPWRSFIEDIEYLNLPEGLTSIGSWAFNGAKSIKDVVLPQSLVHLNQYAFMDCHSIHTFAIGPNLSLIAQHALNGCYSLTNLYVPDNVTEIRYEAFSRVPNVAYSEGRENRPDAGARTVDGIVEEPMVYDHENQTTLSACSAFAKGFIRVKDGVQTINSYAFFSCFAITAVELPNSVETVGKYAFDDCDAVQTLIIGSGLQETNMYAFSMKNLKNVVCKAVATPELGMNAFYDTNVSAAVLYVPDESVDAYKAANQWKNFGSILPISQIPDGIIPEGLDQITNTPSSITNKVIKDGQVLILRGDHTFTLTGQEVK